MRNPVALRRRLNLRLGVVFVGITLGACQSAPGVATDPPAPAEPALVRYADTGFDELDEALLELAAVFDERDDFPPEFLDTPEAEMAPDGGTGPVLYQPDGRGIGSRELASTLNHQHPLVERWITYFTTRGQDQYQRFLDRKGVFGPFLLEWLADEDVPGELIWLAFIESGINPRAYSRAHAAGIWQFIAATGRRYGLRYDFWLDDRRDPERATRAAARHLKDLYRDFGSWELAMSAYNAGPRRVQRAIAVSGHRDYWRMVHNPNALPRETRHYVPKLVAAARIGLDPEAYGFARPETDPALHAWQTVELPPRVSLEDVARLLDLDASSLQLINLHLRRGMTPPSGPAYANVPTQVAGLLEEMVVAGRLPQSNWGGIHVVRRGDTLWDLARMYGTSVADLRALNGLTPRSVLRPGQRLAVPVPGGGSAAAAPSAVRARVQDGELVVQAGDTLGRLASALGVSLAALREANSIQGDRIHVGQRLRVPDGQAGNATSTAAAPRRYRVQNGDTLWGIARRFGVEIHEIRNLNNLRGSQIQAGEVLLIPGAPTS